MKLALLSFALAAVVGATRAQVPTACVVNCLTVAQFEGPCTGLENIVCMCTSAEFQALMHECLVAECTAADQADATALYELYCV